MNDINLVGGKNASLGEMLQNLDKLGINIPNGFALTTDLFDRYIAYNGIETNSISVNDYTKIEQIGSSIRNKIISGKFQDNDLKSIRLTYNNLLLDDSASLSMDFMLGIDAPF